MPTKPLDSILDRDLSIAEAQDILLTATPLMRELVNNGTNVFGRCAQSPSGGADVDLAPMALYRHVLEMTDAVEVLTANCCAAPALPIVRSSFEGLLSLDYIFESDADYEKRSLSWLAEYNRSRIAFYMSLLPDSDRGKQFRAAIAKDKSVNDLLSFPTEDVQTAIDNLERLMNKDHFRDIQTEFERLGKRVPWHGLFGGPPNTQQLANHVGRDAQYDFLYRVWSRVAHARDFSAFLTPVSKTEAGLARIRNPEPIRDVTVFASTFMLDATRKVLLRFRPEEAFKDYYLSEVQSLFDELKG